MVESNLSEISSEVIRKAVIETVENKLKSKNHNIHVSSASQSGDANFIGIVYRVAFREDGGSDNGKTPISKLILKVAPSNLARREQFFSRPCFLREIYLYNEVLPVMREFEQSKGIILEENGFTEYPKCYRTGDSDPDECVLLEDLSVRGFSIIDRHTQEITAEHVQLVMQTLGKFHAISFALKDQQPEKFKEIISNLNEIFIRRDDPLLREYFANQAKSVFTVLTDEKDAHLLEKTKKLFETNSIDIAADCLDVEATGSASIITHGDVWSNNTMFTYGANGKPNEVSLLDWQIARHSSPIIDIVYYMFSCTTKQFRDAHYEKMLKVYHDSLSEHIRRLGSDPEQLFPYKTMQEHFRKFGKFGLILAFILLPIMTKDAATQIDLDGLSDEIKGGKEIDTSVFMSDASTQRFNSRLHGVVVDMDRLGYI